MTVQKFNNLDLQEGDFVTVHLTGNETYSFKINSTNSVSEENPYISYSREQYSKIPIEAIQSIVIRHWA